MRVESDIVLGELLGVPSVAGTFYHHNGTNWVLRSLSHGSFLVKGANDWEELTPVDGKWLEGHGAGAAPTYETPPTEIKNGPWFVPYRSGGYYPMMGCGHSINRYGAVSLAGNQVDAWPWVPSGDIDLDQIGIYSNSSAGANIKVLVYSALSDNTPGTLLYTSSAITLSATGILTSTVDWSFTGSTLYWVGFLPSASTSVYMSTSLYSLGWGDITTWNGSTEIGCTTLRLAMTYASPLATWTQPIAYTPDAASMRGQPILYGRIA